MYTWGALNYYFHIDGQQFFFLFFNFTSFDILLSYNISISQDYFFFPTTYHQIQMLKIH